VLLPLLPPSLDETAPLWSVAPGRGGKPRAPMTRIIVALRSTIMAVAAWSGSPPARRCARICSTVSRETLLSLAHARASS